MVWNMGGKANNLKLYIFNYANTLFPEHKSDVVMLQKEKTDKLIKPRTRLNIGNICWFLVFFGLSNLPRTSHYSSAFIL